MNVGDEVAGCNKYQNADNKRDDVKQQHEEQIQLYRDGTYIICSRVEFHDTRVLLQQHKSHPRFDWLASRRGSLWLLPQETGSSGQAESKENQNKWQTTGKRREGAGRQMENFTFQSWFRPDWVS